MALPKQSQSSVERRERTEPKPNAFHKTSNTGNLLHLKIRESDVNPLSSLNILETRLILN